MTEAQLWELHQRALCAFNTEPSDERERLVVDTYAAFLANHHADDQVAVHEAVEALRYRLQRRDVA